MAQVNMIVGDIEGNAGRIISDTKTAYEKLNADLIIFPELALTGYPPEDLLLRPELYKRVNDMISKIKGEIKNIHIIVGFPEKTDEGIYNSASLIHDGRIVGTYHKQYLPNYRVFDEKRYFISGNKPFVFKIKGIQLGITICEDAWYPEPIRQSHEAGAGAIININASPFHIHKNIERENIIKNHAKKYDTPIIYVNLIGGQDELVFDGGSFVTNGNEEIIHHCPAFKEGLYPVDMNIIDSKLVPVKGKCSPQLSLEESSYEALVLGVRDYVNKNNFSGVVIGVSGGIDSALTLAIAVDAIGSERVEAVSMPSRYTADMSIDDARTEAKNFDVEFNIIPIEPAFKSFQKILENEFKGYSRDTTEENIQARCRGLILMAISNKKGKIVLTTGNKSEMAVGYATLYGDMAGGFCALKDVSKTMVYKLSNFRNTISPVIPERVIERPPTAELAPDQKDQDSLPPYDILDSILELYVEERKCMKKIIYSGFDSETVKKVIKMVDRNEYKRRQAPPGVRITHQAFGRDRRYPITSGFNNPSRIKNISK